MRLEKYQEHAIHTSLEKIDAALRGIPGTDKDDERYESISSQFEYLKWVLEKSQVRFLSKQKLTDLQNQVDAARQQIEARIANGNLNHLNNAESQLNEAIKLLPSPRRKTSLKPEAQSIVQEVEAEALEIRNQLRFSQKELEQQLETLTSKQIEMSQLIETMKTASEQETGQIRGQFGVWEEKIENLIGQLTLEFNERFSSLKTEKSEEFELQSQEFAKFRNEAEKRVIELNGTVKDEIRNVKQTLSEWREKSIQEGESYLSKIENIYNMVGNTALAGDFINSADKERSSYSWNSKAAAFCFLATAIFLAVKVINVDSWLGLLQRLPAAAIFLIPGFYFSSLAQKNKRIEVALRSLGIKIAAFDAYIANLSNEEQGKVKLEMAEVFFQTNISPDQIRSASRKEVSAITEATLEQLNRAINVVKSAIEIKK